ncbi:MAG: sensor histidine kinase, partial [Acidimicrobiales bacterium]
PPLPVAMPGSRLPMGPNPGRPGEGGRAPLHRLADIARLVDAFRQAGRPVTFDTLGEPPEVSPSAELAIYRLVSEALTNAARYAPDSPVEVQVIYSPTAISVFVDDQGTATPPPSRTGGGHGLLGCSERLAALGASLEAGPRVPGPGWRVHAKVPLLI